MKLRVFSPCVGALAALLAWPALGQDSSAGPALAPALPAATEAAAAPAPAPLPTTAKHAGVLKSVQGDVQVQRAGGSPQPLRSGDQVAQQDRILTGKDGAASLLLRDGTALVLGANSQLDLKQYHFDSTTHEGGIFVSLLKGSLRVVSGLIAKARPEAVRIDTRTATIGIRGTDFIVVAEDEE